MAEGDPGGANAPLESLGENGEAKISPFEGALLVRKALLTQEGMDLDQADEFGMVLHFLNDPESLQNAIYTTKGTAGSMSYSSLERSFGSNAPNLLNPNHDISNQHPQISRNLRARIQAVFEQRGSRDFSLCNCKYIPKASPKAPCVGHDQEFQDTWETKQDKLAELRGHARVTGGILMLCPDLQERIRIHGVLGKGSKFISLLSNAIIADKT